jgi:serine/threonine-protein kinase HipA
MVRLPQEDFCQALGLPRSKKYEQGDGGPGIKAIDSVLKFSSNSAHDRLTFLKTNILFWLLCAPDGHAKNFSLMIEAGGTFRLTKLYDVMSIYPMLGTGPGTFDVHKVKLAMAPPGTKSRHFAWTDIMLRHWGAAAEALRIEFNVKAYVEQLAAGADAACDRVRARMPSDIDENTADKILQCYTAATAKALTGGTLRSVVP